jgi:hypothetical protein
VGANAVRQVRNLGFAKGLPRLIGIAFNRVAIEPNLAVLVSRNSLVVP